MSYRIILLSDAQLARSSVWGRHKALKIQNQVGGIDSVRHQVSCNASACHSVNSGARTTGRAVCVFYLHGVEADGAEAVHAPGERADRAAPLLIPDVHLLATSCKHGVLLVVVQPGEDCLQGTRVRTWLSLRSHNNCSSQRRPVLSLLRDPACLIQCNTTQIWCKLLCSCNSFLSVNIICCSSFCHVLLRKTKISFSWFVSESFRRYLASEK